MQSRILKLLAILALLFIVGIVLLVRFTNTKIALEKKGKVILGYDHQRGHFLFNEYAQSDWNGLEGPYLINGQQFAVDQNHQLIASDHIRDSFWVSVDNQDRDCFPVLLNKRIEVPPSKYYLPSKLIAISDIEGNFNAFSSFLISNQVIDQQFNWIFGDGALVLVGDFVDRGSHVTQVLWLIYKLEQEARIAGGKVHFLMGNHEIMNFQGQFDYAKDKYKKIAAAIGKYEDPIENNKLLFSTQSELGRWMRQKNVIEKIGPYLFVHAGLSPEILNYNLTVETINETFRQNWDKDISQGTTVDNNVRFLLGNQSPVWYRGMAIDHKYYDKIEDYELEAILTFYEAKYVVIGHTIVDDISTDFGGRVIKIDGLHGKEKFSGKTKGIFIENQALYKIDDLNRKQSLQ